MRPFEILTVVLASLVLLSGPVPALHWLVWPMVCAFGVHLCVEWPRIQMIGLYWVVPCALYGALKETSDDSGADTLARGGGGYIPIWALVLGEVTLAFVVLAARSMPVAVFRTVTGPYKQIGLVHCVFRQNPDEIKLTRTQIPAPDTRALHPPFELVLEMHCKIFYPAGLTGAEECTPAVPFTLPLQRLFHCNRNGRGAPFMVGGWTTSNAFAKFMGMPGLLFSATPLARILAVEGAAIASDQAKYPVIIFCHGLGGTFDCYAILAQDLASHGYVVVAPTFNDYSSSISYLSNGRVLPYHDPPNDLSADMKLSTIRTPQLRERAREVLFIRDALLIAQHKAASAAASESGCTSHPTDIRSLLPRMSLDSIGVAGHSFGAATSVLAIQTDQHIRPDVYTAAAAAGDEKAAPHTNGVHQNGSGGGGAAAQSVLPVLPSGRFAAAILHDMWTEPLTDEMLSTGLGAVPALAFESQQFFDWKPNHNRHRTLLSTPHTSSPHTAYAHIHGSRHQNYSDFPYFSPGLSRLLRACGPIDLDRCWELINYWDIRFLQKTFPNSTLPDALKQRHTLLPPPAQESGRRDSSGGGGGDGTASLSGVVPMLSSQAATINGGGDSHPEVIFAIGSKY